MWWSEKEWAQLTDPAACGMCADAHLKRRAGRAVADVFEPRKIDYLVMGHRMPHLHCHLLPQHSHDDPRRNVDISDGPVLLPLASLRDDAGALRRGWETAHRSRGD